MAAGLAHTLFSSPFSFFLGGMGGRQSTYIKRVDSSDGVLFLEAIIWTLIFALLFGHLDRIIFKVLDQNWLVTEYAYYYF